MRVSRYVASFFRISAAALLVGCSGNGTSGNTDGGGQTDGGTTADLATVATADCSTVSTHIEKAVCAANNLLAVLPAAQRSTVNLAFTASADRTKWSNLPGVTRPGVKMGLLDANSQAAALALMSTVLSSAGVSDLTGVRAADDYLNSQGGGMGGGGGGYGASNYLVAIFGTPTTTGNWEVMFGGHHMAYNITYLAGTGYPIPNHLGVEPKAAFTINGSSYQPMLDEGADLVAAFTALSAAELDSAYLTGQTFADVLIGPVEYGTGSAAAVKAKFPTGANRTGVLVSSLTSTQQALVTAAIKDWVSDYDPAIASALLTDYTAAAAYADTYIAWGGTKASGVNPDVNGTYMRIDGPRVWIELACQSGVVIQGQTHYHSIFRDKQYDYGGTL